MTPLAEAACELPWLAPCAGSLVALCRPLNGRSWATLRRDPGLALLLLRPSSHAAATSSLSFYSSLLHDPGVLQLALDCLTHDGDGFVDWNRPHARPLYRAASAYARTAEALALKTDRCDAQNAWVGGLLAPLGWLATATLERPPVGVDHAAVGRRLAANWNLPPWLSCVVGHLGMPLIVARALGADPDSFQIVQLAVALVEETGRGLGISVGANRESLLAALDLTPAAIQEVLDQPAETLGPEEWKSPFEVPLLGDVLRLSLENRHHRGAAIRQRLHADLDALHEATRRQFAGEEHRLHERKLRALAELAAGAGHEINNPLAVISGQAQYLQISEHEPARRKALQTIVGQTQRIHQTLTGLMQFARPPIPHVQRVDLGGLLREITGTMQSLADERQVRLSVAEPPPLTLLVDPAQLRTAISALVRNALEAAPALGWANVEAQRDAAGLTIAVEDSGPGPLALDREHLFDPFYCGRKAGRGRGLGLPTAWQLARQHGGDIRLAGTRPTRFVLALPAETIAELPLPQIASETIARAS